MTLRKHSSGARHKFESGADSILYLADAPQVLIDLHKRKLRNSQDAESLGLLLQTPRMASAWKVFGKKIKNGNDWIRLLHYIDLAAGAASWYSEDKKGSSKTYAAVGRAALKLSVALNSAGLTFMPALIAGYKNQSDQDQQWQLPDENQLGESASILRTPAIVELLDLIAVEAPRWSEEARRVTSVIGRERQGKSTQLRVFVRQMESDLRPRFARPSPSAIASVASVIGGLPNLKTKEVEGMMKST